MLAQTKRGRKTPTLLDGPDLQGGDVARPCGQLGRVAALMADGQRRTLHEIAEAASGSQPGVSAKLRDLRKRKHGGHQVERRRRDDPRRGEYRVVPSGDRGGK